MMPVIRISDDTWSRLQKYAIPLVDTPDTAIKKILDLIDEERKEISVESPLNQGTRKRTMRKSRGRNKNKLPQKEFEIPLLQVLYELGGRGQTSNIRGKMFEHIRHLLREGDSNMVSTGEPRWWNATCWARNDLKKRGLIRADSPRGTWDLTKEGIDLVESNHSSE